MSYNESSDKYTLESRAFHRRSLRSHGLEESVADSGSDAQNDDSDNLDGAKRPAEDPINKVNLVFVLSVINIITGSVRWSALHDGAWGKAQGGFQHGAQPRPSCQAPQ